jgi:hypothetical protein
LPLVETKAMLKKRQKRKTFSPYKPHGEAFPLLDKGQEFAVQPVGRARGMFERTWLLYKGQLHKERPHDHPSQVGFLYSE